jgi:hypothetical protein
MEVDYMDHDIKMSPNSENPDLVTQAKWNNTVWEMNLSKDMAELTLC